MRPAKQGDTVRVHYRGSSRTDTSLLSACDEFEEQPDFFVAAFKKQRERLEESLPGKGREVTE